MRTRKAKWLKILVPGVVVLQISACFGGDPQFFFTSSIANAIVFDLVSTAFNAATTLLGNLGGTI